MSRWKPPVSVAFNATVTNPVVLVNYIDAGASMDFGANTMTVLDSNGIGSPTISGNRISLDGSNNNDGGWAVQITGTFGVGTPLIFTFYNNNDTAGMAIVKPGGTGCTATTTTTPITATTTATTYKVRVTPKSHASMPAVPGAAYTVTALVSGWTGSNSQTGSDTAGATVTVDNLSPANVTAATATSGNGSVSLAWTNPADADLGSVVVLRRAGSAVTDTPTEGATYTAGGSAGATGLGGSGAFLAVPGFLPFASSDATAATARCAAWTKTRSMSGLARS